MKKIALVIGIGATAALYFMFHDEYRHALDEQNAKTVVKSNSPGIQEIKLKEIVQEVKNKKQEIKQKIDKRLSVNNEVDERIEIPNAMEFTPETLMNREEIFLVNKEAELDVLESTLASMQENDLPDEEIEQIKSQIVQIESQEYIDEMYESIEYGNVETVSQMRENLMESLKQRNELTDEERESMAYSVFPDEGITNVLETEDTSMPPHEIHNL
jgi:hypothetical protein